MSKSNMFKLSAIGAAAALALSAGPVAAEEVTNVGTPVTEKAIADWDISVYFDGENLPEGSGTLMQGEEIYLAQCAMCHGEFGEGAKGYPKMLGAPKEEFIEAAKSGEDTVGIRGINNFWGHAPTLYDYIRRAMPFFAPASLSDDQSYAVTGYVLYLAEVIGWTDEPIDAEFIKNVEMPMEEQYYTDPRPDVDNDRCMKNCYAGKEIEVKGKAVIGDVSVGEVEKAKRD